VLFHAVVSRRALALAALVALVLLVVAPAGAQSRRWAAVAGKSSAGFRASFPLGEFSGRTEDVSGEFETDVTDLRKGVTGVLSVKAATLRTGDTGRDRDMRKALAVAEYPEIRFTVQQVDASFPSLADRSDVLLTIRGVMSIHGVERPMTFPGRARLRDDTLWVRGETELRMSDFGITPPTRLLLRVKDTVFVEFDVRLSATP
jgi:polyisoprenoid-binding protein YceI